MLIMAIGAQNAFVLRQGLRREHVLPVVALCALSDACCCRRGVGHGRCAAGAARVGQWMRWAGAAFCWLCVASRCAGTAAGPAAGDGGRARQQPAQHGAHAAGPDLAQPHVYLDTVVLLGTMASPYPTWGGRPLPLAGPWPARCGSLPSVLAHAGWRHCSPAIAPGVAGAGWGHGGLHDGLGICDGSAKNDKFVTTPCDLVHSTGID